MSRPRTGVHTIEAAAHGRYLTVAPAGGGPAPLLVGFHGYGENAEQHLQALGRIPGADGWLVVAVEALHLFYTRSRDVVGCWMTYVGREEAIVDNVRYVARVLEAVRREHTTDAGLVFAGFSQGVAMAYRAAAHAGAACDGLVVLGGDVPPDVAEKGGPLPPILMGRGTGDTWYTRERHEADLKTLAGRTAVEPFVFEGGHEWTDAFVEAAGEFLARVRSRRSSAGPAER
jgi:predicted esterase